MSICQSDIRFQPRSFELLQQFERQAAMLATLSVQIAHRSRSDTVIPAHVREALETFITEIAAAFSTEGGAFALRLTEEDFGRLSRSGSLPDAVNPEDDNL
jgi:hypothetical protein